MRKARTNKLYKAAQKEIHSGQALFDPNEKGEAAIKERLSPRDILKQQPKKLAEKDKSIAQAEINRMEVKKIKMKASHSKHTTPGEVDTQSSPRHPHIEGERWKHTVDTQSVSRGQTLDRKLSRGKKR